MRAGDLFAGRFRLLGRAGVGGSGEVWRASDGTSDGAIVAVKLLARDDEVDVVRLAREGTALRLLERGRGRRPRWPGRRRWRGWRNRRACWAPWTPGSVSCTTTGRTRESWPPGRAELDDATRTELEAAAFRKMVAHLRKRNDVQNIDLMNLAGFCRNCLSKWYADAARDHGQELDKAAAREIVYGMPYDEWKDRYQT